MCVIVIKKTKDVISDKELNDMNSCHHDGYGLMWHDTKLQTYRTLDFKSFKQKLRTVEKTVNDDKKMIIHFRRGRNVKKENAHPFRVNNNLAFVHNGYISNCNSNKNDEHTDTYLFNEMLKKYPDNFIHNLGYQKLIKNYIDNNKIVFMDNEGKIVIMNENMGFKKDERWYSNKEHLNKNVYTGGGSALKECSFCKSRIINTFLVNINIPANLSKNNKLNTYYVCRTCINKNEKILEHIKNNIT